MSSLTFGKKRDIPDSLQYLYHNNLYVRYSHGFTVFLKDVEEGYGGFSAKPIKTGLTIEPELGTFILKDKFQLGISYLYLRGESEDTVAAINYEGYGYDDAFFIGFSAKIRYFILNIEHLKAPIGLEGFFGKSLLKSGTTNDPNLKRGISNYDPYGDYDSKAFGGGITGSFVFYPFWFLSIGLDTGIRLMKTQGLIDRYDGEELSNYTGGTQTLNLSGFFLKGFLSLQM
jgi:hypothetical protein